MSSRLFLLAIVTGLFVTVWSSDQRNTYTGGGRAIVANQDVLDKPLQQVEKQIETSEEISISISTNQIPVNDIWMFGGLDISLPKEIAPGEYRVVDNMGQVQTLTLSSSDLTHYGVGTKIVSRNFYTLVDAGRRYYFIRVGKSIEIPVLTPAIADDFETSTDKKVVAVAPLAPLLVASTSQSNQQLVATKRRSTSRFVFFCRGGNRKFH